jgi:nucleoside-diphosphate-sugar epimerase
MTNGLPTGAAALFGASGAVGHALAPALERQGIEYRAVGRDVERLRREFPRAQPVAADFFSGDGVAASAQGVDTVFYLAGAPYTEFYRHPIMVRHALDAAQAAGAKRFIHVAPVNASGFATMVVHLPDFYGPYAELSYANSLCAKRSPARPPPSSDRLPRCAFVYVPDVAEPLLRLATFDDAYGRCWNLGGRSIEARDFINRVFLFQRLCARRLGAATTFGWICENPARRRSGADRSVNALLSRLNVF